MSLATDLFNDIMIQALFWGWQWHTCGHFDLPVNPGPEFATTVGLLLDSLDVTPEPRLPIIQGQLASGDFLPTCNKRMSLQTILSAILLALGCQSVMCQDKNQKVRQRVFNMSVLGKDSLFLPCGAHNLDLDSSGR